MKYLGLSFTAWNCETDLTNTVGKYYGKLNNILSVLGNRRDETCAVHLTNTYCLPTLLYATESWSVRPTVIRNLNMVWNHSEEYSIVVGVRVPRSYCILARCFL